MAKFDAGKAVEVMEWDFTQYGGGKGTIPEPSTGAIDGFFNRSKVIMKEIRATQKGIDTTGNSGDELDDLAGDIGDLEETGGTRELFGEQMSEAVAVLCGATVNPEDPDGPLIGGSPSVEDIKTLPFRVLQAFIQWIMEEIRPKTTTTGTRR